MASSWHMKSQSVPVSFALGLFLGVSAAACNAFGTVGEGPVKSETRPVQSFTRIDASNGVGVTVRIGASQPLEVRAQENILPILVTEVQSGTLHIRATKEYTASPTPEVVIVTPSLDGITMSGGSRGQADGLASDRIGIELSGGSGLTMTGTVATVALQASGGSRATLDGLSARTVTVDLSGGTTANVRASDEVTGQASGGSHLTVLGGARVNVTTSGASSVTTN
jgi:hypothetical protein